MIGLIKMLATPLIFFAVVDAFLRSVIRARSGLIMIGISAVNAILALAIGMTLANSIQPGRFLTVPIVTLPSHGVVPGVHTVRVLDDLVG